MAKNLRQKYKDAKKKLRAMNWRLLYPTHPIKVEREDLSIRKLNSVKTVDMSRYENARESVMMDIAFELGRALIDNRMVNVSETYDPYSGRVYIFAEVDVVDKTRNLQGIL